MMMMMMMTGLKWQHISNCRLFLVITVCNVIWSCEPGTCPDVNDDDDTNDDNKNNDHQDDSDDNDCNRSFCT